MTYANISVTTARCLIVLDDLKTHGKILSEISLCPANFPGRESYPGDIFHISFQSYWNGPARLISQKIPSPIPAYP